MSDMKTSPFAPESFPTLPPLAGFEMATAEAGVKYKGRTDLWVLRAQAGTEIAGVFTKNACPGAPVDWSRKALLEKTDGPRLVIVNSGTANVFAGQAGRDAVVETANGAAAFFGADANAIQLASTGVIGVALEASKLVDQFPNMDLSADGWEAAARAIMTTDTHPKGATATAKIGDTTITLNGIAKGSGMIAPNMATMLAYVATDAKLSHTLLLLASGAAEHETITTVDDPALAEFRQALHDVLFDLSLQIVKDGEGISKFVTIKITGAVSDASAHRIGMSVANSPLVKTAIAGEDANWGRIIMAVGKAGEPADRDTLSIWIGPHVLAEGGQPAQSYREEDGAAYMKNAEILISVDLGLGDGAATVYTCDLTHSYIDINMGAS